MLPRTALDLLVQLKQEFSCCPRVGLLQADGMPSNGQLMRWLDQGAVTINGKKAKSRDLLWLPVTELVFFKGKPNETTIV